jgi:anti-sigma regulatory factor (Ser/Thr protein kinase)
MSNTGQLENNDVNDLQEEFTVIHEQWLPPNPEAVPAARHKVLDICQGLGVTTGECSDLDLALGEALANAVMHGSKGLAPLNNRIYMGLWSYHKSIIIQVHNCGPGFDPPPPPYEMPKSMESTHGRGFPLMECLTDAMVVCRGDVIEGGASTFLIKHLPQTENA